MKKIWNFMKSFFNLPLVVFICMLLMVGLLVSSFLPQEDRLTAYRGELQQKQQQLSDAERELLQAEKELLYITTPRYRETWIRDVSGYARRNETKLVRENQ